MEYLIAIYTGRKIYTKTIKPGVTATVGEAQTDNIIINNFGLGYSYLVLACDTGGVRATSKMPMKFGNDPTSNRVLSAGDVISITDKITLAVFAGRSTITSALSLDDFDEIRIGRSYNNNDICLKSVNVSSRHALLQKVNEHWTITDKESRNGTFVNGELIAQNKPVNAEDVNIFMGGFMFRIQNNELRFMNVPDEIEYSPDISYAMIHFPSGIKHYPMFKRSPRLRLRTESSEFEILPPPNTGNKPSISWLSVILPPVMMASIMGCIAAVMKNYTMLMYSLPMSMISVIIAVVNYKTNLKKWNKNNDLALEKYSEHLNEREHEIIESEGAYISALSSSSPGVYECMSIAENVSRRLCERTPRDNDFMKVRLGTGKCDSNVSINLPHSQMSVEENIFIKHAEELEARHKVLKGIPVCHSFKDSPITGLAGNREAVIKTSWRIIMDIAVNHSYEDVKIICIYPEDERQEWESIKWIPHIWNNARTKRFMACTKDDARIILRDMAEILKVRRRDIPATGLRDDFIPETPFYFLILADRELTEFSGEQFIPESASLGFAAMYAYGDLGSLPGECQSVIMCGSPSCIQNTTPGSVSEKRFYVPDVIHEDMPERFSRSLAPIRLIQSGGGSRMPRSISFMQGFNLHRVNEFDVTGRWENNSSPRSLAAPIGIRENGDTFSFDIQDRSKAKGSAVYMGPHGVTAGTAGSGKSEMLTTWLLSMALNFSPEDVNFVLIEFKGNDLSNILKPLPHIAGVVSNLDDTSAIVRCLRSLNGEVVRRQKLFKEATEKTALSALHILDYQAHRKIHKELEPMPYLIIVADEFAQFATQYPDYVGMFTDIARIGRSLGMYMVLTMQSPQGVIKGQVKANITFNICLRTASASDSKEIIGTNDAFRITAPGRAIVKVGDNAVYEQVQTFYAKAPYSPNADKKGPVTDINIVALSGKRTRPEIYDKTVKATRDEQSEGRAITSYIIEESQSHNISWANKIWTDPLPLKMTLDDILADMKAFSHENNSWAVKNNKFTVTMGLVDDPENQKQFKLVLDFEGTGHQVVYGAPSTGKTTFLQTVLLSAALCYTPDQVHFLIFDYGNWGLKIFETLPHCITVVDPNDKEKIKDSKDFIYEEINSRKNLFASLGVGTLEAYQEVSGKTLPALIVAVDNMASLNALNPDITDVLINLSREGGSLGIYLLLSASTSGGFMFRIAQYVKSNHVLQMTDKSDYRNILGGTITALPGNYPGRGLTKGGLEFQTALCVDGQTDGERVKKLRELCALLSESWKGKRASFEHDEDDYNLEAPASEGEAGRESESVSSSFNHDGVVIGVNRKNRKPSRFIFKNMNGCVISGTDGGGKSMILAMIAHALNEDPDTTLYVYEKKDMIEKLCPNAKVAHDDKSSDTIVAELAQKFDERDEDSEGRIVFCIDDLDVFYEDISQKSADILDVLSESGSDKGIYIYSACSKNGIAKLDLHHIKMFINFMSYGNAIVAGGELADYGAFSGIHKSDNIKLGDHECCMIHNNKTEVIKTAKPEGA